MIVLICVLSVFAVLLFIPIGVDFEADNDHYFVRLQVTFLKFLLAPIKKTPKQLLKESKKKKKPKKKKASKQEPQKQESTTSSKKQKSGPSIMALIRFFKRLLITISKHFPSCFHLKLVKIHVDIGTEDAAKTALTYALIGNLVESFLYFLQSFISVHVKHREDICLTPNFLSDSIQYDIHIKLFTCIFQVLKLALSALFFYLKHSKELKKEG